MPGTETAYGLWRAFVLRAYGTMAGGDTRSADREDDGSTSLSAYAVCGTDLRCPATTVLSSYAMPCTDLGNAELTSAMPLPFVVLAYRLHVRLCCYQAELSKTQELLQHVSSVPSSYAHATRCPVLT
eukprot:329111-Rhodomonas_salina.1